MPSSKYPVTGGSLADGSVTTAKVADNAVTGAKVLDGTITTADIADGAITSAKIADAAVITNDIADGAVTTAKVDNNAITSAKIADGTIVDADISPSAAIAFSKLNGAAPASHSHAASDITSGTIAPARLGSGTPTSTRFLSGDSAWTPLGALGYLNSVSNSLIDNGAVTASKLNQMSATSGQVLTWNGTAWAPTTPATGGGTTVVSRVLGSAITIPTGVDTPTVFSLNLAASKTYLVEGVIFWSWNSASRPEPFWDLISSVVAGGSLRWDAFEIPINESNVFRGRRITGGTASSSSFDVNNFFYTTNNVVEIRVRGRVTTNAAGTWALRFWGNIFRNANNSRAIVHLIH